MRLPISCLCIGTLSLERDPVILDCTQVGSCNGTITFNETALSLLRGLITTGYLFESRHTNEVCFLRMPRAACTV